MPHFEQNISFQGVLAKDGDQRSFIVFRYRCTSAWRIFLKSKKATIGFVTADGLSEIHPLTFSGEPFSVACLNAPATEFTDIVYQLKGIYTFLTASFEMYFTLSLHRYVCSKMPFCY